MMKEKEGTSPRPYWDLIGMELIRQGEGESLIELPIKYEITQSKGSVHGGALASLVDSTAGAAVRSLLSIGQTAVTIEMKLNYIRPATGSKLIGKGSTLHIGKSLAVGEAVILNEQEKVVVKGIATFKLS
jgi:uncharacterized protein (TIGR00369 family)